MKPKNEEANIKALAEMRTKELTELTSQFEAYKAQIISLEKLNLLSETDYRNLPDELKSLIEVGMGGSALKALLDDIDLS